MANSEYPTRAGAFIAMDASRRRDPRHGLAARASTRTCFAKPISQKTYDFLTSDKNDAPLLNRATESALSDRLDVQAGDRARGAREGAGLADREDRRPRPLRVRHRRSTRTPRRRSFGPINVSDALKVSSDIFFFKLGAGPTTSGHGHPAWAKQARVRAQDRDRPAGRAARAWCPDAKWRNAGYERVRGVRREGEASTQGTTAALYECGGIERGWTGGDNVNLAVGQGDLQATPLQLAVAYAALANNGTIVAPAPGQGGPGRQRRHAAGVPHQARKRKIKLNPRDRAGRAGRPAPRRPGGEGHLRRRVQGLADEGVPGLWEDRHGRARPEPRPGVVRMLRGGAGTSRSSSSTTDREGRLRRARPPRRPRV